MYSDQSIPLLALPSSLFCLLGNCTQCSPLRKRKTAFNGSKPRKWQTGQDPWRGNPSLSEHKTKRGKPIQGLTSTGLCLFNYVRLNRRKKSKQNLLHSTQTHAWSPGFHTPQNNAYCLVCVISDSCSVV